MMQFKLVVLSSLLGLNSLLCACARDQSTPVNPVVLEESAIVNAYNPDQSVSSDDATVPPNLVTTSPQAMMIEGTIEQVMESWPLQLTVTTRSGRYYVSLQADTAITQQGTTIAPEKLKPGLQVQITGQGASIDNMALTAQSIQIQ